MFNREDMKKENVVLGLIKLKITTSRTSRMESSNVLDVVICVINYYKRILINFDSKLENLGDICCK